MTTTDAPHKDYWAKQARKAIRAAVANLCPHQIDRRRGKCAECERPAKSETDAEENPK